jgi:hypothetical protein
MCAKRKTKGKRKRKERRFTHQKLWTFAKRALILVGAVLFVASLYPVVGGESLSKLGILKEAFQACAEAAADAFGDAK